MLDNKLNTFEFIPTPGISVRSRELESFMEDFDPIRWAINDANKTLQKSEFFSEEFRKELRSLCKAYIMRTIDLELAPYVAEYYKVFKRYGNDDNSGRIEPTPENLNKFYHDFYCAINKDPWTDVQREPDYSRNFRQEWLIKDLTLFDETWGQFLPRWYYAPAKHESESRMAAITLYLTARRHQIDYWS